MKRKLTALLTAVLLVVTLIPMTAWAELVETVDAVFIEEAVVENVIEAVEEVTEQEVVISTEADSQETSTESRVSILGATDTDWKVDVDNKLVNIYTADGLLAFNESTKSDKAAKYSGYEIHIKNDIDIAGNSWTTIDAGENWNGWTIDGENHKITGLGVPSALTNQNDPHNYGGAFLTNAKGGYTVKDITFDGATVTAQNGSQVAVIIGMSYGNVTFDNVTVSNSKLDSATKTGAFLGQNDDGLVTMKDCSLVNTTVKAEYSYGLMIGLLNVNSNGAEFSNCSADKDSKVIAVDVPDDWEKYITIRSCKFGLSEGKLWLIDPNNAWAEQRIDGQKCNYLGTEYAVIGGKLYYADKIVEIPEIVSAISVKFDAQGGIPEPAEQEVNSGENAVKPETDPAKDGFTFACWYNGDVEYDFTEPVNEDLTLTAKWLNNYSVAFDAQGGEPAPEKQTIVEGQCAKEPETDPEKERFEFAGWYLKDEPYDFSTPVTADTTLTAKWEEIQLPVDAEPEVKPVAPEVEVKVNPTSEVQEQAVDEIKENPEIKSEETTKTLANALKTEELKIDDKAEKLEVSLDINLLSMDSNTDETKVTALTFEVTPILIQKDENGEVIGTKQEIPNSALNQSKIYVRLPIPSSINENYAKVVHRSDDGKEEQIRPYPEVKNKGTSKAFVELQITHFSEFELTFTDTQYVAPTYVSSGSSEKSEPLFTGTWNNPVKGGAWTQDTHGIWHYATSQTFRNTWGYIFNPYAKEGQHTSDWFWFDAKGNMLTGWQFINGKWYYLNPNKDGTLGACQLGGVTPDGWTVDANGAWIESIPKK